MYTKQNILHSTERFSTVDKIRDDSVRRCWLYLSSADYVFGGTLSLTQSINQSLHETCILRCVKCVASVVVMLSFNTLPLEIDQNRNTKMSAKLAETKPHESLCVEHVSEVRQMHFFCEKCT